MFEVTMIPGDAVVETWAPVLDPSELSGYLALEKDLHLMEEGRMFAWLVEMDTKYATSEPVFSPYAPAGRMGARFYPPVFDEEDEFEFMSTTATEFEFTVPEGDWSLRILGGRYDHLIVLTRKD